MAIVKKQKFYAFKILFIEQVALMATFLLLIFKS